MSIFPNNIKRIFSDQMTKVTERSKVIVGVKVIGLVYYLHIKYQNFMKSPFKFYLLDSETSKLEVRHYKWS